MQGEALANNPARTVLILGPSGVGKSQLAANVFDDSGARTVDLRLWIRAETRTAVLTAFGEAADRIQVWRPENASGDQKAAAFLEWLAMTERSWLIVFDNLSHPEQLTGLWPRGKGRVLVTSYRQDASILIGTGRTVRLDVFTPAEAMSYLERRAKDAARSELRTHTDLLDEAEQLARELVFLPVALAQCMSVILFQAIRCRDYRRVFRDRANTLAELFPERLPADEYERTVATTWALAMEQAASAAPGGVADRLVQLIAVTDPAGVPEAVIMANSSLSFLLGNEADDPEVASSSSDGALTARTALRGLHALSLIEHQLESPGIVRMHGLLQRVVQESMSELDEAVLTMANSLDEAWSSVERDGAGLLLANTEHITGVAMDALWADGPHPILLRAGRRMRESGMLAAAIRHFEWLCQQASNRLGDDTPASLVLAGELATTLQAAGKLTQALSLLEQSLVDHMRVLGPDDERTLIARHRLASTLPATGRLSLAIDLLEKNLEDGLRVLPADNPNTFAFRDALAVAYRQDDHIAKALQLSEQNLSDVLRVLGPDNRDSLSARNNLASIYVDAGDPSRAIELHEQNLIEAIKILGPDHPDTLICRDNLATALREAGNAVRAFVLFKQNLADRIRVLSLDHPAILVARNNLASAFIVAGNLTKALAVLRENLAESKRILGPEHPETWLYTHDLGTAYLRAGEPEPAVQLLRQVFAFRERTFGPRDAQTAYSRCNLGSALLETERGNAEGMKQLSRGVADLERSLGKEHPVTRIARRNLDSATGTSSSRVPGPFGLKSEATPELFQNYRL